MFKYSYKGLITLVLASLLTACASTPIKVDMQAGAKLNPDDQGNSLPVLVKFYQLADQNAFQQATFWQLWNNANQTLGNSLLASHEEVINPGSEKKVKLEQKKQAQYLGIMAIFRNPQGDQWRVITPLPTHRHILDKHVNLKLSGTNIEMDE